MWRGPAIRKGRRTRKALRGLKPAEIALCLLFGLATLLGAPAVAEGLPQLAAMIVPGDLLADLFAAEARGQEPSHFVNLPIFRSVGTKSPFAPQVLFPVTAHGYPAWLEARRRIERRLDHGVTLISPSHAVAVAIVLDDMGNDVGEARRAIALPRGVTLSFLPYPDATPSLARAAERAGHEVIVHLPMQAVSGVDPGPMALRTDLPPGEIARRVDWDLSRVPGYAGANNHMGSRFTQDEQALVPVVERLAVDHVFFLDSRTTANSKAIRIAHMFGVASAGRDIFLDDVQTPQAIGTELSELEAIARHEGVAIAIGHPHPATLDVLARWTKTAKARGITLVPLGVAIRMKTEREIDVASNAGE